jgi:hypothetical protein
MISRAEQIKLKQGQKAAQVGDAEYRDCLQLHAAVHSSTDPRMTHEQFEQLMGYFEACYWTLRDLSQAEPCEIFQSRGYWSGRCRTGESRRARWVMARKSSQVNDLEQTLIGLGVDVSYLDAIRARVMKNQVRPSPRDLLAYGVALTRTMESRAARSGSSSAFSAPLDAHASNPD